MTKMRTVLPFTGQQPLMDDSTYNVPRLVYQTLRKHYSELQATELGRDMVQLSFDGLGASITEKVQLDVQFLHRNPTVPLENLCCRMDNYEPRNDSQRELLEWAERLMGIDDSTVAAGLFMWGDPGVGKTHMAVAMTKEYMKKGVDAYFSTADDLPGDLKRQPLGPNQVRIIDDLNSSYGLEMGGFKEAMLNAHNKGGRLFVTSNTDYTELMRHAFVAEEDQRQRYMDRTEGMLQVVHVLGQSQRARTAWYRQPK